jgi:hypothetical protein
MTRPLVGAILTIAALPAAAQQVPRMWDDAAMATLELPLAEPAASPEHAPAGYYYRIPVRAIYKSYPVYAPGHEPAGHLDWLRDQEPVVIWDDADHAPTLKTKADWIKAGEVVFDAPVALNTVGPARFSDPVWYQETGTPVAKDGNIPFFRYVIQKKGVIDISFGSCSLCHTRVMFDGSVLKGAQGNFPFERNAAYGLRRSGATSQDQRLLLGQQRALLKSQHSVPWLHPDPEERVNGMSLDQITSARDSIPPGVIARGSTSLFYPAQVPDLIGVEKRRYLDRTGLQQHRSIVDLMRYSALNQGGEALSNYAGFVPADIPRHLQLPDTSTQQRYSDEQLYALALYLDSLQPPANPNRFDAVAARGKKVFEREGCARCHAPPLYTNNMLTPAEGFTVPEGHKKKYDILPISVGTDGNLTLKTRRGTGYYKVPSLKGLWYRGMFPHDGSCATLEDWFDARRLRDDYVPTGFKGYGIETRAVKGHEFGLKLPAVEKQALIAFLKTL